MRIRTKLLCILLALALPPLVFVSYYALREGGQLGKELANHAAESFRRSAEQELALMVDLIGEDLNDNRQMLELALTLMAREAAHALTAPPVPGARIYYDRDFDAAGGLPQGTTPFSSAMDYGLPVTGDALSCSMPPGAPREAHADDAARLTRLLPTFEALGRNLGENMLWSYVALPNGLMCSFPGHGSLPHGYDPRDRPWYREAVARRERLWSIIVDASTGRLVGTISKPVYDASGKLLGVAAIDAPLEAMLPESDLSRRWGDGVRALIVHAADDQHLNVLASRDFAHTSHGWDTPLHPVPLASTDTTAMARLVAAIAAKKSELTPLSMDGNAYFAVLKPFPDTPAGLLVLVPKNAVLHQADSAETAILSRTRRMLAVVVAVAVVALLAAAVLAYFGARAVTRPVTALCRATTRLAQGDMEARAPVAGKDELAELADAFNAMAPKLAERLRLKQDMLLAMEVQQNLLPVAPPSLPGLDIAGGTIFCDETGGDYFDYLQFNKSGTSGLDLAVGDATGHGIAAALFMATGRALLRGGQGNDPDPAALLTLVNSLLCKDTADSGRFITLFFLRLEQGGCSPAGSLRWARAGHDPALLYDPATDAFTELMGPGLPLGILPEYAYTEQTCAGLAPGQMLALGTDGIWEARNPAGEMYGKDRFRAMLRSRAKAPAAEILAAVHKDVADFQAGSPRDDDITLVVIKCVGM
jgi:sigma-B regulation protein RsbU (phosphoserine phosphatase)